MSDLPTICAGLDQDIPPADIEHHVKGFSMLRMCHELMTLTTPVFLRTYWTCGERLAQALLTMLQ